jgi:hypothetical protein
MAQYKIWNPDTKTENKRNEFYSRVLKTVSEKPTSMKYPALEAHVAWK